MFDFSSRNSCISKVLFPLLQLRGGLVLESEVVEFRLSQDPFGKFGVCNLNWRFDFGFSLSNCDPVACRKCPLEIQMAEMATCRKSVEIYELT